MTFQPLSVTRRKPTYVVTGRTGKDKKDSCPRQKEDGKSNDTEVNYSSMCDMLGARYVKVKEIAEWGVLAGPGRECGEIMGCSHRDTVCRG